MKKFIPFFVVSILVLGMILLWISGPKFSMSGVETWQLVMILLLVGFGFYFAFKRFRSVKRNEPAEDELSRRILQKASSLSYYVSLYLWIAMIFVDDRIKIDTEILLGAGIVGMAVIWAVLVIFFKVRGLKNE